MSDANTVQGVPTTTFELWGPPDLMDTLKAAEWSPVSGGENLEGFSFGSNNEDMRYCLCRPGDNIMPHKVFVHVTSGSNSVNFEGFASSHGIHVLVGVSGGHSHIKIDERKLRQKPKDGDVLYQFTISL